MSTPRKGFDLAFTDGKMYDIEKIIELKDRENSSAELIMKVDSIEDGHERELEHADGQLVMPEFQKKLSITRDDIKKYLY